MCILLITLLIKHKSTLFKKAKTIFKLTVIILLTNYPKQFVIMYLLKASRMKLKAMTYSSCLKRKTVAVLQM